MNEDRVLVRAHVAIAGGPPKGEIDWVSRELYEAAAKSGKLESVENLSSRLRAEASEVAVEVAPLGLPPVTDEMKDAPADGIEKEPVEGDTLTVEPTGPPAFTVLSRLNDDGSVADRTPHIDPDHPSVP